MSRYLKAILALFVMAAPALAQTHASSRVDKPIVSKLDVDTPTITATTNYIVTSTNVVSSTYTLAHQPDVPRNITGTITDTTPSITAGTITIVGTDVNGVSQTEAWSLVGPTLTFTGTKLFASVTSITGAGIVTLGGAGDETIVMGVGSTVSYSFCSLSEPIESAGTSVTSGSSATVTSTSSAFALVGVGDELTFTNVSGQNTRVVTARASASSITVDSAVNLGSAGTATRYRTLTCGYGDTYGWMGLAPVHQALGIVVRQMTATGGLDYVVQGRQRRGLGLPLPLVSGNFSAARTAGAAPTSTSGNVFEIADTITEVRVGFKFGTTDDSSDTGPEQVDATLTSEVQ